MDVLYQRCAGLDVSKRDAKTCVRITSEGGRTRQEITTWSAMTNEVNRLAEYLLDQDVGLVVMEATGDYWRQFYFLLEARGLNVQLVHAREARTCQDAKPMFRMRPGWPSSARTACCTAAWSRRRTSANCVI
jgi:transposase